MCLAILPFAVHGAEPSTAWPLWDGKESTADYAQRAKLPPTQTLNLGNGVNLELVLIPAGKFTMGTPEREKPIVGQIMLAISGFVLLAFIAVTFIRAWKRWGKSSRPKYARAHLILYFLLYPLLTACAVALPFYMSWPLIVSGAVLLALMAAIFFHAWKKGFRPQYSLGCLTLMTWVAAFCVWGGVRWWQALQHMDEFDNERPAHLVTLTKPFFMGKFTVTQEQYQQVMGNNPSNFKGAKNPVEIVSWDDAQEFCKKIGRTTNQTVRLPTEAEWEYSCRAGTQTAYCNGDGVVALKKVGWCSYDGNWGSAGGPKPVGSFQPNAWGLYDMHGNVWQWCQDWYGDYKSDAIVDPQGPAQGAGRVLRGGTWYYIPGFCRSAFRDRSVPGDRSCGLGFRVVWVSSFRTP
jgi:formylglycine-generating enzyme required for sulfatase activity